MLRSRLTRSISNSPTPVITYSTMEGDEETKQGQKIPARPTGVIVLYRIVPVLPCGNTRPHAGWSRSGGGPRAGT